MRVVRSIELLNFWIRTSYISVKSLHLLQNTYYLMSESNLDVYCQWVLDAREFFSDKQMWCTMNSLQQFKEHTGTLPATSWLEIVKDNEIDSIRYLPVCSYGQEDRGSMLGTKFVLGKHSYNSHPSIINESQVTESVKGDGECDT